MQTLRSQWGDKCDKFGHDHNQVKTNICENKWKHYLLVKSSIQGFGIRELSSRSPGTQLKESGILLTIEIRNPVLGVRNPRRVIQNSSRLSWITLHWAINRFLLSKLPPPAPPKKMSHHFGAELYLNWPPKWQISMEQATRKPVFKKPQLQCVSIFFKFSHQPRLLLYFVVWCRPSFNVLSSYLYVSLSFVAFLTVWIFKILGLSSSVLVLTL